MSAVLLEGIYTKFIQISEQDIQKIHFPIDLERNRPILEAPLDFERTYQ